jgi:PAS domain S-box-containing protein
MEENQTDSILIVSQDQKEQNQVCGVFSLTELTKAIAGAIKSGLSIDSFLANTTLAKVAIAEVITISESQKTDLDKYDLDKYDLDNSDLNFIRQLNPNQINNIAVVDQSGYPIELIQPQHLSDRLIEQLYAKNQQQRINYAKLERESANLKLATELNKIGCWNLNLVTQKAEWNDIHFQLMGIPINPKIANYFNWRTHVYPEDIVMVEEEFSKAIALHQELEVRHRIIRTNGEEIWVLTRGKTLYDSVGKPLSMVGVMVDIDEAHRIRLALQKEEKRNLALLQERELLLSSESRARESAEVANREWCLILESITEGFIGLNQQWQVTHANSAIAQLSQIPTNEIIGSNFWQIFGKCQQNLFGQCYQRAMETRTYQEIEGYHPNLKVWLQVRVFPSELGLSIFVRDLSNARKLEIERNRLFDYSRGIMAITDRSGVLGQVNPAWQQILGYDVQQSIGQNFLNFIYPPDQEKTINHMIEMDASGKPQNNFEIRYCDQDGEIVWLSWDCIPFPDEQKIYGFGRDITHRKKAEQELIDLNRNLEAIIKQRTVQLEDSANRTRAMLNAIPDMLMLLKRDGICLDLVMPSALGLAKSLPISKNIAEILPYHCLTPLFNAFDQAIATQEVQIYEYSNQLETEFLYEEVRVSPCGKDEVLVVIRNISDRKAAELKLQNSLEEKEILLKEIHHRVKNNLNLIDGLLNLQIHSIENNEAKQLLQNNRDRISIMGLVHQQLYQTERLNQVDLAEYIQSLCQNLHQVYVIKSDQILMEVEIQPEIVGIDTAISIGLIINELLTNAFKHAFPNPGFNLDPNFKSEKILVQCYRDMEQSLHLWVKDNGIGTDISLLPKSTSLGMELVKILAKQLRATVEIESNPVVGTNVHLFLANPITID